MATKRNEIKNTNHKNNPTGLGIMAKGAISKENTGP
jgi:hypothetical protein